MVYMFHMPVNGKPVGVNVEKTHEDAYHDALFMKILVFIHFFYDYDTAVGRCHNDVFGIFLGKVSDGTTEEIDNHTVQSHCHGYEEPERYLVVKTAPQQQCYGGENDESV